MSIVQNSKLLNLIQSTYTSESVHNIVELLEKENTFTFSALSNGLFPAAITREDTQYTGYRQVWIRDNIYVAYAHYVTGETHITVKTLNALMDYFKVYRQRFERIIDQPDRASQVMERPHVRFDGEHLQELPEDWSHAQNDALGYFLWLYCKFVNEDLISITQAEIEILALFPLYFEAIGYWEDSDSGHWEEARKIEASSVGVAKAGLTALRQTLIKLNHAADQFAYQDKVVTLNLLDQLIRNGEVALSAILPYECRSPEPKVRRYDAALLFLIYPLNVLDPTMADQILDDVISNLQGDYGIKRYLRDSFWAADYRTKLSPEQRTANISDDMTYRDSLIREGQEAQWCIFDPIISIIFGQKFQTTGQAADLEQQIFYLNRALGQLTGETCEAGELKCPELYYLEDGKYRANDATPLLWTQANLKVALKTMIDSIS
jgi:GH15 family glucan-1,4-alpha-glucosidase